MKNIQSFFKPIQIDSDCNHVNQIGNRIKIYTHSNGFPSLDNVNLVLIGVNEDRGAMLNVGSKDGANEIRKQFYKLFVGNYDLKFADLGNLIPGDTLNDTYFAINELVNVFIRNSIFPIIIGGSNDLAYGQYLGYQKLEQIINIVSIDSVINFEQIESNISNTNFVEAIIKKNAENLFNYSHIGYQTYLNNQDILQLMRSLYFDCYRLGELRNNIIETEPIIRQSDMLVFDVSAIKHADMPAHEAASPNGFYAEEACQMMNYAGLNDKLASIGIYEYNPTIDRNKQGAKLIAQMLWVFIDAFYLRQNDFPLKNNENYVKFHVIIQDGKHEINFFKSKKTDRWWMEVPILTNKNSQFERHSLIPCSYVDYQTALQNDLPNRWWQAYQRMS